MLLCNVSSRHLWVQRTRPPLLSPDPIVCFGHVFKQRMVFATSFPKTRLWSLSGSDQWLTDNRELLSWSLRNITKIFRIPHLFPRQLYLQIIRIDTMLSAFFFHGSFASFPSSFVDGVSWVEYFKRVLVFNRCIFCSFQFRLTLQRMKHPGIKYYTLVVAYLFITISSFIGAWPKWLLKQARLTITYSSALRALSQLLIYIVCLPLKLSNISVVEFPSAFATLRAHVPTIWNTPCDGARLNF